MRTPLRAAALVGLTTLVPAACDQPTRPDALLSPGVEVPAADLALTLPALERAEARSEPHGAAPADAPEEYDIDRTVIHRAESRPFAGWGRAGNQAITEFTGNRIKVVPTTTVRFLAEPLVSNFSQTFENSYAFPKNRYTHSATTQIYIDGDCGHSADGHAQHDVWVEWGPVEWGWSGEGSSGPRHSQRPCSERIEWKEEPTSGGGSGAPPMTTICWYRITYDQKTGQIVRTDFLYCEG